MMNTSKKLLILLLVFGFACRETPPEAGPSPISLTAEDIGVTDVALRVQVSSSIHVSTVSLSYGDNVLVMPMPESGSATTTADKFDTLLWIDSLKPATAYTFRAELRQGSLPVGMSALLTLRTMDSTSHAWSFEVDTLGDGAGSVLRDVCIVNDTMAIAVGEIYKRDSTGEFETRPYNAARWNGTSWQLLRIQFRLDYGTSVIYSFGAITSVFALSDRDIWFVHYVGGVTRYKDGNWIMMEFPLIDGPGGANKIWGTSPDNLYFVADLGRITRYDGERWTRMESGTDVDLLDVWGTPANKTRQSEWRETAGKPDGKTVFACGWEDFKPTVLLKLEDGVWEKQYEDNAHRFQIRQDSLSGELASGQCFGRNGLYLLSSAGLYRTISTTNGEATRWSFRDRWFPGFPFRMRGADRNDLTFVGEYYMLVHFNGISFRYFSEFRGDGRLFSVDQKGGLVVAVGVSFDPINRYAVVFVGRR